MLNCSDGKGGGVRGKKEREVFASSDRVNVTTRGGRYRLLDEECVRTEIADGAGPYGK